MAVWWYWKNSVEDLYIQYFDNLKEIDPKLLCILKKYGSCFDGYYEYKLSEDKSKIIRSPLLHHKNKKQKIRIKCPNCNKKLTFPKDVILLNP